MLTTPTKKLPTNPTATMRQPNNRKMRGPTKSAGEKGRSRQEVAVLRTFPNLTEKYESIRLPYKQEFQYIPDIVLSGGVVLELKEYLTMDQVAKYEAIARCNQHIKLIFWVQKCSNAVLVRLRSNFTVFHGMLMPLELRLMLINEANNASKPNSTTTD